MARAKTRLKIPGFCPIILCKTDATKVVQLPSIWVRGPKEIITQKGEARDGR